MILVTKTSDQTRVCVCVCVFFPFILDVRLVGVPAGSHIHSYNDSVSAALLSSPVILTNGDPRIQ